MLLRSAAAALLLSVLASSWSSATLAAQDEPEAAGPAVQSPFQPFDRAAYEAHSKTLGATDAQLQQFARDLEELGVERAADALTRAVRKDFDAAVRLGEDGDPAAVLALAEILGKDQDPVLGGHVRYHLARLFLDSDDPERAVEILNEYFQLDINRTPLDGEAAFFYAQALAEIPRGDLALPRLRAFLLWFPNASERFRATAQQRIGELERQQESRLHVLADRMKKVGRDLKKQKTNEPIQVEQKDMVEELNELIEMYEQMEQQSGGAPSGNAPSNNPATQSALTEGEGRIGNLEKRASLADRWGPMPEKERKQIESQVQSKLPPQYRKLIEGYYKKLGTGDADK